MAAKLGYFGTRYFYIIQKVLRIRYNFLFQSPPPRIRLGPPGAGEKPGRHWLRLGTAET